MGVFEYETDPNVIPGTVEYDPIIRTLSFHSLDQLRAWQRGQPGFRLIIHWIREAPPPRYR